MTRRAGVARHRERRHTEPTVELRRRKTRTRDNVAKGTLKGWTFGKRNRAQPEYNNGIRNRGIKQQLRPGSRTLNMTLETAKQTVGTSIRLRKMNFRILWRGRPPPKRKKRPLAAWYSGGGLSPIGSTRHCGHHYAYCASPE
jgi:hypothetical protein